MSVQWSADQRRCLAALGYTVCRPVAAEALPVELMRSGPVQPNLPPSSPASPIGRDGLLVRALLRAAGFDPAAVADPDGWLLVQGIASLPQLRRDPAAKRALWPRLRALRSLRTSP